MQYIFDNQKELEHFGRKLGSLLKGGETIELIGDVGAGKTTLTKAIGKGLGVDTVIQSPSFTISQTYPARDSLELVHYDFYRLRDPGILSAELSDTTLDPSKVTVIEWGDIVEGVLPMDRISIHLEPQSELARRMTITGRGEASRVLVRQLE